MQPFDSPPYSSIDVILMPALLALIALFLRFLAWNLERQNKNGRGMKFASYVPVVLGFYIAGMYLYSMYNPSNGYFYRDFMKHMKKVQIAHYISIALPFVLAAAFFAWGRVERRLGRPISI